MFERSKFIVKRKYKNIFIFLLINQKLTKFLSFVIVILSGFIALYYNKLLFICFNIFFISNVIILEIKRDKLKYYDPARIHLTKLINKKELEALINHKPEIKYNNSFTILEYYYNLKKDPLEYERIMFEDI